MRNWLKMAVMEIGFIIIAIWRKSNVCSYTIRPFVMLRCWYDRMVNYRCGRMWTMRWPTDRRHSTRWTWRSWTTRRKMTAFLEVVHKGIISWSIVILVTTNDSCIYYAHRNKNLVSHFSKMQTFINNNKLKLCCRWYDYTFTFHCTQYRIYYSLVDSWQSQCFSFASIFSESVLNCSFMYANNDNLWPFLSCEYGCVFVINHKLKKIMR